MAQSVHGYFVVYEYYYPSSVYCTKYDQLCCVIMTKQIFVLLIVYEVYSGIACKIQYILANQNSPVPLRKNIVRIIYIALFPIDNKQH